MARIAKFIIFSASPCTFNFLHATIFVSPPHHKLLIGMAEIKIDKNLFHERLSHFYSAWKADKRSGDAVFGGASSILVLMGKTEESVQFQKNNALHVYISDADLAREMIANDI